MPLVPTSHVLRTAERDGFAAGAFNVVQLEQAEAVLAGAQQADAPVILQISENAVRYHGGLAPIAAAVRSAARTGGATAAMHLDHATGFELIRAAAACGFGSVMYDGSRLPWAENVRATREITAWCHDHGLLVEAELGEIGGKEGDPVTDPHTPGARTDPAQAAEFVAATRVDALAVAVGSTHAMTVRQAVLDMPLLAALREAVPVPLVLHGSSGVPDDALAAAVGAGIRKVNIATHLNRLYTRAVRDALAADPDAVDPRRWIAPARDAVAAEVARLLAVLAPRDRVPSR